MANVFQKILSLSPVELKQKSQAALDWYRQKANNQRLSAAQVLTAGDYRDNITNFVVPGSMYLFAYDAKHKETLPYWDRYPLVFPFQMEKDGFLGINLHYLPPSLRAELLSALMSLKSTSVKSRDLALSYSVLNSFSKLRYFKPCVKRYLSGHVRSRFLYIEPEEWPVAIFLPLQKFQGASAGKVYADSKKRLGVSGRKRK